MALLNREKLLQKQDLKIEKVVLDKKTDEYVYVREMTGRERDQFEQSLFVEVKDSKGNVDYERSLDDFRAKLAVNTVCDEKGNLLFKPADIPTLSQNMGFRTLNLIMEKAQEVNKITEEDREAMVKN